MDFDYGTTAEDFRAEVRAWLADNLDPDWRNELVDVSVDIEDPASGFVDHPWLREWDKKLYHAGYKGLTWPAEYGGRGLSMIEAVVFAEEFARAGAPMGLNFFADVLLGPTLIQWGTEEQKARFLPKMLSSEELWCQGFSEPNAGSDLASLTTRAVRDGDEWVISGQKVWTTMGHLADWCFVLARTDPDAPAHKGISFLLVPMRQPGVTVRPLIQMTGSSEFNEVFFDEARCPVDNVVGGLQEGWKVAMTTLGFERGSSATTQYFRFMKEWRAGVELARERGRLDDPIVRQDFAKAYTKVMIMKASGYRTVSDMLHGDGLGATSSINKMLWSEYHRWFTEVLANLRGPEGLIVPEATPFHVDLMQHSYLFAKSETIWGGTAEIQRNIVGERILGLPKEPKPQASAVAPATAAAGSQPN